MKKTLMMLVVSMMLVCTASTQAGLNDGLVAYYPFDGDTDDYSGNDLHGTKTSAIVWTQGVNGQPDSAVNFTDSVNALISLGSQPQFNTIGDLFTITFWVKFDTGNGGNIIDHDIIGTRNDDWQSGIYDNGVPGIRLGASTPPALANIGIEDGTWHHVAVRRSQSTGVVEWFIDGEPNGTITGQTNHSTASVSTEIGPSDGPGGRHNGIVGCLDDFRFYNRLLLDDEIEQLYLAQIDVVVDIKPGSCLNPLNIKSKGVLPVAILETQDFDVLDIDALTIQLAGVDPNRSSYEDVGTPAAGEEECATDLPDGILDLVLKFDTQAIVEALGEVADGEEVILELTGLSNDDTPIVGQDYITIRAKGKGL